MSIVLTEKELNKAEFPSDVRVETVSLRTLEMYDHSEEVVAIAGSRAMAIKAAGLDLPGLKIFQLTSAGFDGVPCEVFARKGVVVSNAGSVYSAPIAETVVFGMLQFAKKLRENPNKRGFKLQRHYDTITELSGKQVMVLGAGSIGTAIAQRLSGFELVVDGYAQSSGERPFFGKILSGKETLSNAIGEYDYVISTLPDSTQTRQFIDAELLSRMKPSAVIINVGRQAVLHQADLFSALKKKQIGGAVLDMFERIPNPIQNKFRRLKNVIVLPGVAAISREVTVRLREHMTSNLVAALSGAEISSVVNGVK